ncbi:MAG: S-layer homology domain-containing protein [Oscillospiraceae bacterium]|nr:S-layer homology domain-containing protein [Oscillospiraceae bacterium]
MSDGNIYYMPGCSASLILAIKNDGSLWGLGFASPSGGRHFTVGQTLGINDSITYEHYYPQKIMDGVKDVVTGGQHYISGGREYGTAYFSAVLKTDGSVWTWGSNGVGQLGDRTWGSSASRWQPKKVMDGVTAISAADHIVSVLKTDGSLWTWGLICNTPEKIADGVKQPPAGFVPGPDPIDDPSPWAIPVINTAIEIGYLTPELQGGYQYNITRGEFCALAVSLIETLTGQTMEVGTRTFADDGGDLNIRKMAHLTIINGYSETTFGTNDPISRQDAAMILDRIARREQALNKELFEADVTFTDMHLVTSENTAAAIRKMSYSSPRIMAGDASGTFRPLDNISRQETISTLNKLCQWYFG